MTAPTSEQRSSLRSVPPSVFISFFRTDRVLVRQLSLALSPALVRASLDETVPTSSGLNDGTRSAIDNADFFLFVLSPASLASEWNRAELALALMNRKNIIPLIRERPTIVPRELAGLTALPFGPSDDFAVGLNMLRSLIFGEPPSEAASAFRSSTPVLAVGEDYASSVRLKREGGAQAQERFTTPELGRLFALAARLDIDENHAFDLSFFSLLIAFHNSDDQVSRWFRDYVARSGVSFAPVLKASGIGEERLRQVVAQEASAHDFEREFRITRSAAALIDAGLGYREGSGSALTSALDVRHIMAAFIYGAAGHERDFERIGLNRPDWSSAFLNLMARNNLDELTYWKELHGRVFPEHPVQILDTEGPSTHIATDVWTVEDDLGYASYAHAICRFMTHPRTKPPLTISIQAPWGGGKTSLMRMIQKELDPQGLSGADSSDQGWRGKLSVKAALHEIDHWLREKTEPTLPSADAKQPNQLLTVWFNAWKYENTNQVWAGLVDEFMRQIAARLQPVERELFWLRLNIHRVDVRKVRDRLHARLMDYWWRAARIGLAGFGGLLVLSGAVYAAYLQSGKAALEMGSLIGMVGSVFGATVTAIASFFGAQRKTENEPAAANMNEYLDVPDYRAELGFVHQVEADLRRVLASVPSRYQPIVIFIDDLDRCSPTKVAEVIEAVNLFLAGDFPNCLFVLGMDAEMVAAALQSAHQAVTAQLPRDAAIPVGWRFMDKFIQLPFVVPPPEPKDVERYTTALLKRHVDREAGAALEALLPEALKRSTDRVSAEREAERVGREQGLDQIRIVDMKRLLEAHVVRQELDSGLESFNDNAPEIRRLITDAAAEFSRNPRDLKRFVNAFRFQYFLWWAYRAQTGKSAVSMETLQRWVVFSMKWPEVVRWLWRGSGREWSTAPDGKAAATSRMALLEDLAHKDGDAGLWRANASARLKLSDTTPWLLDGDLHRFLRTESSRPAESRLSAGAGKGLW